MATEKSTDSAQTPDSFPKTVDEFCADLSSRDRRIELIYAFSKSEKAAGNLRGMADEFQNRFEAFANKPV